MQAQIRNNHHRVRSHRTCCYRRCSEGRSHLLSGCRMEMPGPGTHCGLYMWSSREGCKPGRGERLPRSSWVTPSCRDEGTSRPVGGEADRPVCRPHPRQRRRRRPPRCDIRRHLRSHRKAVSCRGPASYRCWPLGRRRPVQLSRSCMRRDPSACTRRTRPRCRRSSQTPGRTGRCWCKESRCSCFDRRRWLQASPNRPSHLGTRRTALRMRDRAFQRRNPCFSDIPRKRQWEGRFAQSHRRNKCCHRLWRLLHSRPNGRSHRSRRRRGRMRPPQ